MNTKAKGGSDSKSSATKSNKEGLDDKANVLKGAIRNHETSQNSSNESGSGQEEMDLIQVETGVGRPINLSSKRQQDLLNREIKAQLGLLHKGRPVDTQSERQQRLKELEEKRTKGLLKLGRPAYSEEQRKIADEKKKQREAERMEAIKQMAADMIKKKDEKVLELAEEAHVELEETK